ncbi:MAG: in, partial [Thermomicrobiales bacterium]|nr:in [Thermomicrobiales bacterium]
MISQKQERRGDRGSVGRQGWLALALCVALLAGSVAGWSPGLPGHRATVAVAAQQSGLVDVIVVLKGTADPRVVAAQAQVNAKLLYHNVFRGFSARVPAAAIDALARNPQISIISEDLPVRALAQTVPTGVKRIGADQHPTAAIDGKDERVDADVAILDTGIDPAHPDLNVAGGIDCTGTGSYADDHSHGTHVAGTVGALDNDIGVVGVAPGVRLWAVKVLNSAGSGSSSTIICGLDWVVANAGTIDVVNMSLGGSGTDGSCDSNAYHKAICTVVNAGVPIFAAAGNDAVNAASTVPATYDEVITVSSFTDFDGKPGGLAAPSCTSGGADDAFATSYSNFGADIDIAAPGTCIRSTVPGGGVGLKTGTSMATPHVAGAAALYRAGNPGASPAAVRSWLLGSAQAQGSVFGFAGGVSGEPVLSLGTGSAAAVTPTA